MLSDEQLYKLTENIIDIARDIEYEMIINIAKRIDINDSIGGTSYWQLQQLNQMGLLHEENINLIARYSNRTFDEVVMMIEKAGIQGVDIKSLNNAYNGGIIDVNPLSINIYPIINTYQNSLNDEIRLIMTNAITESNITYQRLIDKVCLEVSGGIKSYDQAIQDGLNELIERGIATTRFEGTNKNGEPYVIEYPIESSVRRSVMTSINQVVNKSNDEIIDKLDPPQIAVSAHEGARNRGTGYINHESWQGKIYSKDDFKKKTGYNNPDMLGLGGYNCRHVHWPYWEGISIKPEPIKEDSKYDLIQHQRLLERRVRESKKKIEIAKILNDNDYIKKEKRLLQKRLNLLDVWCNQNQLVRDYSRERISKKYK